ncbi:uncharacterized protein LOC131158407 [Malania oleifera]|uniref:uncharacterized protein LOC131158407 n=1 Tax=Malania oleifera TaxID=397392 RepID=UPI0025AE0EDE|nr:uncharacterized protein LOC131158407 [Malania oleifera]
MASICVFMPSASSTSRTLSIPSSLATAASSSSSYSPTLSRACFCFRRSLVLVPALVTRSKHLAFYGSRSRRGQRQVVRMAPEEEKLTRRNPLDFPIEWERPKPGRRPDIFPQFSPMKTPLPPPLPCDPPEEDEDEDEEEKKEEEEENPEEEEPDNPEKKSTSNFWWKNLS